MRERPPELFYERLRDLLAKAEADGLTIPELARKVGVHFSRIYRWRKELDGPSGSHLAAMADHFHVTMDWLWGRSNDGGPPESAEMAAAVDEVADRAAGPMRPQVERRQESRREADRIPRA